VTIDELAYLKCPTKIRAALINTTGRAPSVDTIRRRIEDKQSRARPFSSIGEPQDCDAVDYISPQAQAALERRKPRPKRIYRPHKPKPQNLVPREHKATILSERLVREVCKRMDVKESAFYSSTRTRRHVHARAIVCKVLRERNESVYSFPRIGACIAREDHSTVRHLIMNFDVYCRHPDVWDVYEAVRALELSDLVL
jgi:hypothetical protein